MIITGNELDALLTTNGWILECESPLEIRHAETGSFATGMAAQMVIDALPAALQLYEGSRIQPPPATAWPLHEALFTPFIDSGDIVTFTARVPLDILVNGDIDALNDYCQQAFGPELEIRHTEFRVVGNSDDQDEHWDDRFSGDVSLQVTCTLHSLI